MEIKIRRAEASDSNLLLELIKELAVYEKLLHEVTTTVEELNQSLFSTDVAYAVIAEDSGGTALGFALYFFNFSTFLGKKGLYLEDLFVKPEYRGKGVGKALLKHLARQAVIEDCGRMEWSVLKWNEPAIGFYKSIGAYPLEEWDTYRLTGRELNEFSL